MNIFFVSSNDIHVSSNGENIYIYIYTHTHTHINIGIMVSVRQWPGRPGFNPRSSHTKDSKNGT